VIDLPQPGLLFSIAMWVIMIGVLVTVHEYGHYRVGRFFGVKALTFSVGFGSELFGYTDKRGTRWKISALPLGGYVKFLGDMDASSRPGALDDIPADIRNQAFPSKPMWQRALIILAGPLINLVFAFLLFWGLLYVKGVPYAEPVVADITVSSAAAKAGLQAGDRIVEVAGRKISDFEQVFDIVAQNAQRPLTMKIQRNNALQTISLTPDGIPYKDRFGNTTYMGGLGAYPLFPSIVGNVLPKSAAAKAGILPGDKILKLDGVPIKDFPAIVDFVEIHPNKDIVAEILRDKTVKKISIVLGAVDGVDAAGKKITVGRLGVAGQRMSLKQLGLFATLPKALVFGWHKIEDALTGVKRMVTGQVALNELGGPLKIGEMAGQTAALGVSSFIMLMAMISISLGVMNLLPIPMLDGGHLALYAAEAVRGRPLNPKVLEVAFSAGFSLLIGFMVFLFWNDLRMFGVWRTLAGLWS
jgi:regulator of sigma E protease